MFLLSSRDNFSTCLRFHGSTNNGRRRVSMKETFFFFLRSKINFLAHSFPHSVTWSINSCLALSLFHSSLSFYSAFQHIHKLPTPTFLSLFFFSFFLPFECLCCVFFFSQHIPISSSFVPANPLLSSSSFHPIPLNGVQLFRAFTPGAE